MLLLGSMLTAMAALAGPAALAQGTAPRSPHQLVSLRGAGLLAVLDDGFSGVSSRGEDTLLAPGAILATRPFAVEPFVEVLPSWNVDVGDAGGFRVEGRFGPLDGEFGPWVTFGGWGKTPEGASKTTTWGEDDARHRVAVDVLETATPLARLQFRVLAAGKEPVRIEHLSWVLTSPRAVAEGLDRSAPAPEKDLVLDVPARSQKEEDARIAHRICSPTSVSMLLAFHGKAQPPGDVAALLFDAEHDLYGNWNRAVQGAYLLGCRGVLERMATWSDVERTLRAGHPFAISIRADEGELEGAPYPRTSGHLLVLCGLLADERVAVRDPAASSAAEVPRTYSRADLERVWLERNGVAYVLHGPR